jgi:integral membrane sensor domain MASE1
MFAAYKLKQRDILSLVILALLFAIAVTGIVVSNIGFDFFPMRRSADHGVFTWIGFALYGLLLLYPLLIECKDRIRHHRKLSVGAASSGSI